MKLDVEELVARIEAASPDTRRQVAEECRRLARSEELKIGDVEIPFFTIPFFVDSRAIDATLESLRIFVRALIRLEKCAFTGGGSHLFERLMASLTPGGRHLVTQCSYESDYSFERRNRRIDGFLDLTTGAYRIIEVNQAAPLALHYHDTGQRIAARALEKFDAPCDPQLLSPHLLDWLVGEFKHRFGGDTPDTIALVIEHGYPPKFTDLPRISLACERLSLEKYGHPLKIVKCFPYELRLSRGKIMRDDMKIDMIWRNSVYMTSYREQGLDLKDYEWICSHPDEFLIVNSTRSWLTRSKEVFAIMWDDAAMNLLDLDTDEIKAVRSLVPLSVNLGRAPGMRKELLLDRAQWISKPADSGFGKGVEFGEAHSKESWESLLDERATDGFVFQKKIDYPGADVQDVGKEGILEKHRVEFDFCPHHMGGDFTGTALVRGSIVFPGRAPGSLMNLASGGYLLPMVRVDL